MTDPVEVMAKGFDPEIWSAESPGLTRGETEDFHSRRQISVGMAQAALSALDAAGFAVVPKEPTDEMLQAFEDEYVCMFGAAPASPWSKGEALFKAMLSAAQVSRNGWPMDAKSS